MQVQRQMNFVDKLASLGWTVPGRFDDDTSSLDRAVSRYHALLDLMTTLNGSLGVPTLDIDLAWQAHRVNTES